MSPSARLGGFKILNDVVWVTIARPGSLQDFPASLCRVLADKKINMNFFTCGMGHGGWGINLVVQPCHADEVFKYAGNRFSDINISTIDGAVLSLFPHKCDPGIASSLFVVLEESGLSDFALANSYSAISALFDNRETEKVATRLFKPFCFSAFRTPSDWRLSQKGKEALYKEVVASYQERKPKVYVLQWQEDLELVHLKLDSGKNEAIRSLLTSLDKPGIPLSFLITLPSVDLSQNSLLLCLPKAKKHSYETILASLPEETIVSRDSHVAHFSMNGPHFGDRYGIASDLLEALFDAGIDLMGLSCSVASISGIVSSSKIGRCLRIIQECFEVPSLMQLGSTHQ